MKFKPKVISRQKLFDKGSIPVWEDEIELEFGNRVKYTVLRYHNAACVVALTEENRILLVKVPRYPMKQYLWELPGGKIDKSETALQCALRELEEETGYMAGKIKRLIEYYPEPSFSTEKLEIFLATKISKTGGTIPEREGLCEVSFFNFDEALNMILNGQIKSSWSIIGILFADKYVIRRND